MDEVAAQTELIEGCVEGGVLLLFILFYYLLQERSGTSRLTAEQSVYVENSCCEVASQWKLKKEK